ncbi:putative reverse transcriptase zinc-binding domain-containing protein [Helianthus annuus]|nr:putative reverse transcriptase zinc-binding domain-containing protein [Helianthus annuus]KAJ0736787.1 putative reverse transcriptase zinc-binding domain-containing protein [Helianthus annuus]
MPFKEGELPVRYLGVPLISSKLMYKDCKVLVDRLEKRVDNWMTKSLSFAGRLQLINSVLSAMHIYWASVFMLPIRIVKDIEKRMRNFLWSGGSNQVSKPKVAWKSVCLPKFEGGLGIRNISDVNKALLTNHIWSLITKRESLWVKWIHSYRIKGKSFWNLSSRGSLSWGWRKLLSIRNTVRPFIWYALGDGRQANTWNDNWCECSPLSDFISPRRIHNAGFSMFSTVSDIVDDLGIWKWPAAWFDLYPVLNNLGAPNITQNARDKLFWKDNQGHQQHFSSAQVWNSVRNRANEVAWMELVWFGQCIPRHSFHFWLVIKNKLKTQDRMGVWFGCFGLFFFFFFFFCGIV